MDYKKIYNTLYKEGYHITVPTNIGAKFVFDIIDNYNFKTVLDIGCSQGNAVELYNVNGKQAYGIDVSEIAIKEAHKLGNNTCKQASVLNIPFKNDEFDLVVTSDVLEHLDPIDISKAIDEICRVAKNIIIAKIATKKEGNKTWMKLLKAKYPKMVKNIDNLHMSV